MKSSSLIPSLVVLLTLASCGPGADPAVGRWKLDNEATLEAAMSSMDEMPQRMDDAMKEQMATAMRTGIEGTDGELELKADGTSTGRLTFPNPIGGEEIEQALVGTWVREEVGITLSVTGEGDSSQDYSGSVELDVLTLREQREGMQSTLVFTREN